MGKENGSLKGTLENDILTSAPPAGVETMVQGAL